MSEDRADRPTLSLADLERFDPTAPERGRERRFCCPLPACGESYHDARHRSLSVNVETGKWHCHRCGVGGVLRDRWQKREPHFNKRRASSRRAFAMASLSERTVGDNRAANPAGVSTRTPPETWRNLFEQA